MHCYLSHFSCFSPLGRYKTLLFEVEDKERGPSLFRWKRMESTLRKQAKYKSVYVACNHTLSFTFFLFRTSLMPLSQTSYSDPLHFYLHKNTMSLTSLPNEVLLLIAQEFSSTQRELNALVRTCKRFYKLFNPDLYLYNIRYPKASALDWAAT